MKTAIYIEDGVVQLVLTPQNDFEKNALRSFEGKSTATEIMAGQFYDCQGGWTRQQDTLSPMRDCSVRSLIIRTVTVEPPGGNGNPV
jgi:hypothetical protein